MSLEFNTLFTFIAACVVIVIVPGPTVTVIIANSMRHGARAGLLNVAGTQIGLLSMIAIVAAGLEIITTSLAFLFDWLRLLGAAYLIWLGVKLLRSDGSLGQENAREPARGSWLLQGFLVIWSNPKALLFFGAFIPQFIDPSQNATLQTLLYGGIFMIVGAILDGAYALLAGRAGAALSRRNIRGVEIFGGTCLVGGGLWLALDRS